MIGRVDEARKLFEKLLSLRNDLGLLAEEWDSRLQRQVGNFPQAFSHVPLIDTALRLTASGAYRRLAKSPRNGRRRFPSPCISCSGPLSCRDPSGTDHSR